MFDDIYRMLRALILDRCGRVGDKLNRKLDCRIDGIEHIEGGKQRRGACGHGSLFQHVPCFKGRQAGLFVGGLF